ncbi:VIT family protein [Muriicola sp. E247]|uniref:VIT1/CCC1 transporter family protein n=1 Tax=Muriicola sp. E247 TaxID=3242730 RepID=UPI0035241DBA
MNTILNKEDHYLGRSGWLRASILGANDGILSTASLIIGVAAANVSREPIVLAGVAGLVAGALSMAAGEYVSVSSQTDIETSDLAREEKELREMPQEELKELADIYKARGLSPELAMRVAQEMTEHDALGAHARDELGINSLTRARPLQAAFASGASFIFGGLLPVITSMLLPLKYMIYWQYILTTIFLIILGAYAAKAGGSSVKKAVLRITFWGTIAMGVTAYIGHLFGVSLG